MSLIRQNGAAVGPRWLLGLLLITTQWTSDAHAQQAPTQKSQPAVDAPKPATSADAKTATSPTQKPAASTAPKADPNCPTTNLIRAARMSDSGIKSNRYRLKDGNLAEEGALWNSAWATTLENAEAVVNFDFRRPREVQFFVVQGDNNDIYTIEGSLDGKEYEVLWAAPATVVGMGLRTRFAQLPQKRKVRYLRLKPSGGDGFYSVSDFQAYCAQPTVWPPKLKLPPKKIGWKGIDNPGMVVIKAATGFLAAIIMIFGFVLGWPVAPNRVLVWLRRIKVPIKPGFRFLPVKPRWWRDIPLLALALSGLGMWFWGVELPGLAQWGPAAIGGGFWLLWFLLRWMSGDLTASRGPVGRLASVLTGSWVAKALWLLLGAAVAGYTFYETVGGRSGSTRFVPPALFAISAAVGVSLVWGLLRWLSGPVAFKRTANLWLAIVGLFSFVSWWNIGHFHFDHYIHIWEHYHYYVGAKYGPELRYGRLYDCTGAADMKDGLKARVEKRQVRNLAGKNELADSKSIVADPTLCTEHFSEERWGDFRKDIRWFRGRFSQDRWDKSQTDHGYNGTPVWGIAARLIADRMELKGQEGWHRIEWMAYIDSVLLVLMWGVVWWAFGWQATCVALVYWGCNFPARFYWNGGSFLRYDWIVWMIIGICLLRRNKMMTGGMALTYATGLRVFPGFVVAALILKVLARMVRERRFVLSKAHTRFAAGCVIAIAALTPASSWSMNGLDAWVDFAKNSEKHLGTALTNNMGLKTVLGYDFATRAIKMRNDDLIDPFAEWKDARHHFYRTRKPIQIALIGLFCLMLAIAGYREEDWVSAALGAGLIVMAAELTCYYYGFLLTYGLLWEKRKLPGIVGALLAATTCVLSEIPWNDDHFAAMSLASVIAVVAVTAHVAFGRKAAPLLASEPAPKPPQKTARSLDSIPPTSDSPPLRT